jgi:hypothetical protein
LFWIGFHIDVAYSSFGRSKLLYTLSLIFNGQWRRLRFRNPNTFKAFLQMLSIRMLYFRLSLSSTLR